MADTPDQTVETVRTQVALREECHLRLRVTAAAQRRQISEVIEDLVMAHLPWPVQPAPAPQPEAQA